MKASKMSKYFIPCLTMLAASISQVYASDEGANVVSGEVTPKLIYFNYNGGPGGGSPQYLQAYGGERGWGSNANTGLYADVDVSLKIGDFFSLEREGFGRDSHRGNIQGGNSDIGFSGYYGHFRSGSGGLDYLNRPGTANNPVATGYTTTGNAGYLTLFNDDTGGVASYAVERTRYGVGVKLKPDLLGKGSSLSLNFDGYKRDGNKFATYVFGNGDTNNATGGATGSATDRRQSRWRGYNMPVEENMGRFALNFTANPGGMFQLAYDGSYEKFNNQARTALATDFLSLVEVGNLVNLVATNDMHFVPDSTLMTHAFRLSKNYGKTALAVGYGMSRLEQDSYSNNQADPNSGYSKGKISTDNAFFNANHRLSSSVGIEGFVKYANRENDSSGGFAGADVLDREVRDLWGVRIKDLESLNYGLAASFSGLPAKSSLTAGWKHEDKDRDLQYNTIPANGNLGAWPTVVMLQDKSKSDEIYLRWNARPMKDMTLRITPSWVNASKTGYVTEAEDSFNLKTALGYAVTKQTHLNAYYHYKDKKNGDQSFTDTTKPSGGVTFLGTSYQQKANDTFHAAGLSVNHSPSQWLNFSGSVDWAQNDFETYFFGTNARRFEQTIVFDQRGTSNYKVDTLSLSLNADYQPTDQMKLRTTYTWSDTSGDLNTTSTATLGTGAGGYSVNDKVDNTLHSLAFSLDYQLKNNLTLKGAYVYDRYKDKAFSNLNGGHHTLMVGVAVGF